MWAGARHFGRAWAETPLKLRQAHRQMAPAQKITDGVFAIDKPLGITSAQAITRVQEYLSPSAYFSEYMAERQKEARKTRMKASLARKVKMGHGGTLDPWASGVLILGIGQGTKSLNSFLTCQKTYEAVVLFGAATDSYDGTGKIIGRKAFGHITKALVEEALAAFRGSVMQRPPIFSALQMDGKRLYEYAREGKEPPRKIEKRPVEVFELELTEWLEGGSHSYTWPAEEAEEDTRKLAQDVLHLDQNRVTASAEKRKHALVEGHADINGPEEKKARTETGPSAEHSTLEATTPPNNNSSGSEEKADSSDGQTPAPNPPAAKIRMTVSSGFYVRSFCHDLGAAVGSLGLMSNLVRTRQGDFVLGENVIEMDTLAKTEEAWAPELESMLTKWNELQKKTG